MNPSINCPQHRQRCPSPWACGEGCNFNNAVVTKQSAQERAAAEFWKPELPGDHGNPGYPFELLDAPMNFWDRCNWWQKLLLACAIVAVFALFGGMAAGHLAGLK